MKKVARSDLVSAKVLVGRKRQWSDAKDESIGVVTYESSSAVVAHQNQPPHEGSFTPSLTTTSIMSSPCSSDPSDGPLLFDDVQLVLHLQLDSAFLDLKARLFEAMQINLSHKSIFVPMSTPALMTFLDNIIKSVGYAPIIPSPMILILEKHITTFPAFVYNRGK